MAIRPGEFYLGGVSLPPPRILQVGRSPPGPLLSPRVFVVARWLQETFRDVFVAGQRCNIRAVDVLSTLSYIHSLLIMSGAKTSTF